MSYSEQNKSWPSAKDRRTALITGATSGIGESCARKFAQSGYDVIITGRTEEKLELLHQELTTNFGVNVMAVAFDVSNREAAKRAVDYILTHCPSIDVLVNNAGLSRGLDREYEGDFKEWDEMVDTNVKGLLTMTRLVVPGMVERNK